mgnify:CR=1 FL=1
MAKVRLTKNELKNQRMALQRYERFLPTLQLKKQQLQIEARKLRKRYEELEAQEKECQNEVEKWVALLDEERRDELLSLVKVQSLELGTRNIAGLDTPMFEGLTFKDIEYDLFGTPLWYDEAIRSLKTLISAQMEKKILGEQLALVEAELRITTQRVNLFEKVKIPETRENIRIIQIHLGDQQTNAVGRAKIAKAKIQAREAS